MQNYIQQMQDNYARLVELLPELEKSLNQWQESYQLIQQLNQFYQSPLWLELYDNADNIQLETNGNYSVLSQDAIWNASTEQYHLTEELRKMITDFLANKTD